MSDSGPSIFEIIAAGLAVAAVAEILAAQYFATRTELEKGPLIASLLLWEGIAMFACAGVLYMRQDFGVATIISLVAIWMAGAAVGLLRAGVFDAPRD